MATVGRKDKWDLIKKNFKNIEEYSKKGYTEKSIAAKIGVSYSTWNKYKAEKKELEELIKNGRSELVVELKDALTRKAKGFNYEEKKQYIKVDEVTGHKTQYTEINTKYAQPDVAALNLLLKNYDEEWYNDKKMYDLKAQELELKKQMADINNF